MRTWIALLRAINLGSHNKIPMADLRAVVASLGYRDVRTYIASGNVLFRADGDEAGIARALADAVAARWGLDVPVVVRDRAGLERARDAHPYTDGDEKIRAVMFLDGAPTGAESLDSKRSPPDEFQLIGREVHMICPNTFAETKLSVDYFERRLGCKATTRNWRTLCKLIELAGQA